MADEVNGDVSWKKLAAQFAMQYGFPGIVAIVLLAAFLGWIDNPISRTVSLLEAQGRALQDHAAGSIERSNREAALVSEQTMILRQMCVQQARTEMDRMRCLGAR